MLVIDPPPVTSPLLTRVPVTVASVPMVRSVSVPPVKVPSFTRVFWMVRPVTRALVAKRSLQNSGSNEIVS